MQLVATQIDLIGEFHSKQPGLITNSKILFTAGFPSYSGGDTYIDTKLYTQRSPLSPMAFGILSHHSHIAISTSV